jgi:transmembrane sensor
MGIDDPRGVSRTREVAVGPEAQRDLEAEAVEWHVRLRHGDGATWADFADWLAEDPRHAAAYEAIERMDLALDPLLSALADEEEAGARSVPPALRATRRAVVGGALAASIVAVAAFLLWSGSGRYEVATRSGEHRVVHLAVGTEVTLNGASRMVFDRRNPRFAVLSAGEAYVRVVHDPAKPFTLEIAGRRVQDVGTRFDVVRDGGEVRVAVAEGEVVYEPERNAVSVRAGQILIQPASGGPPHVDATSADAVGGWREGRLVYAGEPLSQVAADLSRTLGVRITVAPTIENRPFYGTIMLDRTGPELLRRLAPALDVAVVPGPDGWTMKPAGQDER